MPIYEYECKDCGEAFDALVSITVDTPPDCPKCKGQNVKKKMSMFASSSSGGSSGSSSGCSSSSPFT
ncbi:MAG: zinc ribbon domain-containing protein [Thermodesulfobacteriota bacterium]|nr:zinc ribbon domain-containing protein [Thermodesulfobacteriota bacterium]